ncbi:MAG: hypothetical protein AB8E82_18965 [Aureispira sp.]
MTEQLFGDASIGWHDDHILRIKHLEDWEGEDNLDTAKEVVKGIRSFTADKPFIGMLIVLSSLYKEKEILDFFRHQDVSEIARAAVIPSFAARLIGNMYLKLAKGKPNEKGRYVPVKLFTNEEKAIVWLQQQVNKHQSTD